MIGIRLVVTALVCLGLGLPSAHGIALCIDSDGSVAVEAVVDGACVGSQEGCRGESTASTDELGPQARTHGHCDDCRDVVLSADELGPPLLKDSSAHRFERPVGTEFTSCEQPHEDRDPVSAVGPASAPGPPHRAPPCSTTVLRL